MNAKDEDCKTPLHYAAENGDAEIVKILLKYGADVNAKNEHGFTPLDVATGAEVRWILNSFK